MSNATVGQLDTRLTEIEDMLIGADFGDVQLTPSERSKLETEAEAIRKVLSSHLGKAANVDPQKVYEERDQIKRKKYVAAVVKRHVELHPNDPEGNRILAEAFKGLDEGTKTWEEVVKVIIAVFPELKAGTNTPAKRAGLFSGLKRILSRL